MIGWAEGLPEGVEFGAVAIVVVSGENGEAVGGSGVSVEDGGEVTGAGEGDLGGGDGEVPAVGEGRDDGVAVERTVYWAATTDLRSEAESFAASPVAMGRRERLGRRWVRRCGCRI